jgi:tRNA pseudouridine55 synthase
VTAVDGLVVVDKAGGMTSHDVVSRIRRLARTRRVGHGGTLDPMATGVLVVGVGRATRLLTYVIGSDKRYLATIRLGQSTVTDDAEGEVTEFRTAVDVTDEDIRGGLAAQTGEIDQVPSAVSAIKVDGQRAYKRVRAGEEVVLAPRRVTVSRLDVLAIQRYESVIDVDVDVECSSGTYIRAIARDLGAALGVGGHLVALRRTRVGPFGLSAARTLDALAVLDDPVTLPLASAVRATMPVRQVDDTDARELSYGRPIPGRGVAGVHGAFAADGSVVALLREEGDPPTARPVTVFTPAG